MIVYCNFAIENQITPKQITLVEFVNGMLFHFQNLDFGAGVKEITYYVVGNDPLHVAFYGPGITYGRKSKTIGSLLAVDYEVIRSLEGEMLLRFVRNELIAETMKFASKNIKEYDLNSYIESLESYFDEAMQLMKEGKKPGEGKVLNDDVQLAIARKWSRL